MLLIRFLRPEHFMACIYAWGGSYRSLGNKLLPREGRCTQYESHHLINTLSTIFYRISTAITYLVGGRCQPPEASETGRLAPFRCLFPSPIRYYINDFELAVMFDPKSAPSELVVIGLPISDMNTRGTLHRKCDPEIHSVPSVPISGSWGRCSRRILGCMAHHASHPSF